jgi:hypothetical protein
MTSPISDLAQLWMRIMFLLLLIFGVWMGMAESSSSPWQKRGAPPSGGPIRRAHRRNGT